MNGILKRIERELGLPGLAARLSAEITPTDLQSLLLAVYRRRAQNRSPSDLFADYQSNRFVQPSRLSPVRLLHWEKVAFSHLPEGFETVALSPVAPFGVSAVLGSLDQNWAVTTSRNTEVVSDSTGVLALEAALRRRALMKAEPKSESQIHLASSHRLLRAQKFSGQHQFPHFSVFSLVSAGRARAPGWFAASSLASHIRFYLASLRAYLSEAVPIALSLTNFGNAGEADELVPAWLSEAAAPYSRTSVRLDPARTRGRGYYRSLCFNIEARTGSGDWVSLVDGGMVDWTQKILSSAKERLLISGIGSERLCLLFDTPENARGHR